MGEAERIDLRASVEASVAKMSWLKDSDGAAVDLALTYATQIDLALGAGDPELASKALFLGPHLLNALKSLGGTPADRKALNAEEATHGKLAKLRAVRDGVA